MRSPSYSKSNNLATAAVFLDLKKAFNNVDHQILLNNCVIMAYAVLPTTFSEVALTIESSSSLLTNKNCNLNTIKFGIPQGSTLGPGLFLIFINDLPAITKCKSYHFADDTTVFLSHNNTVQLELELNLEFEKIHIWMNANKLTVTYKNTIFIRFSKLSPLTSPIHLFAVVSQ